MPMRSTPTRYGSVAIAIHWTTAVAIVLVFSLGFLADGAADPIAAVSLLRGHVVLAILVVVLTLLRILWWAVADRRPEAGAGQAGWQRAAAHLVHGLIYAVILLMGTSGIATLVASGALPDLIAGTALPSFDEIVPRIAHGLMSKLLLALLAVHLGAALYHQFVRGDRLLARMGIG